MKGHSRHRRRSKSPGQGIQQLMVASSEEILAMPPRIVRELVHELRIHQIELELQNEELRRTQLELAESRDRYCELYEFAPIGYVTLDKQRRIVESNFTAASLLGVERVQLIGEDISRFVALESRDNCYLHLHEALESGKKQTCQLKILTKNGAVLVIRMESIADHSATGGFHYRVALIDVTETRSAQEQLQKNNRELEQRVSAATADLSQRIEQLAQKSAELSRNILDRKRAEREHREGEQRLHSILDNATDGIVTIDWHGIIMAANPALERMFGYESGELIGRNVKVLMPAPYHDVADEKIKSYLETADLTVIGTRGEAAGLRKDGSILPLDIAVSKIEEFGLFTGIVRDITARKEADAKLEQYRKDLQIASSELMLGEERERRRLAQDLHDNLGQAVFRAIVTLNHPPFDDRTVREMREILADISKVVSTLTYKLSPVILRQAGLWPALRWLAKDVRQRYGLQVRLKGRERDVHLEERVSTVLFRSIREVLVNVAKHAETGFATLSVREKALKLIVCIRDRGKGFDVDDKSHQQLGKSFGLFSVRESLEYIGGSFAIESTPGGGTTVTLTVPLKV